VVHSSLALPDTLTAEEMTTSWTPISVPSIITSDFQAEGIHDIVIIIVPMGGACFLMFLFVNDNGLPDDKPKESVTGLPEAAGTDHHLKAEFEISPFTDSNGHRLWTK